MRLTLFFCGGSTVVLLASLIYDLFDPNSPNRERIIGFGIAALIIIALFIWIPSKPHEKTEEKDNPPADPPSYG